VATPSSSIARFRVLTTVHVAAWFVAVLPPSVGVRAVAASVVASACALAVAFAVAPPMGLPVRMRSALAVHAAASCGAALTIGVGFLASWPDAILVGSGAFVLVGAVHLLVWVGLTGVTAPLVPMLLRPSRYPSSAPWPAVAQALALGDAALLLAIVGTSLAPLFGGIVMAGLAVGGWCVAVFGFALALIDAARAAPALLPPAAPA